MCPQESLNISASPEFTRLDAAPPSVATLSSGRLCSYTSQWLRLRRSTSEMSRSFPRALVPKTAVSARRNDYFKQPAGRGIQSGFLRKCIPLSWDPCPSVSTSDLLELTVPTSFLPARSFALIPFSEGRSSSFLPVRMYFVSIFDVLSFRMFQTLPFLFSVASVFNI